jgi:Ras-related protein Rab-11A
MSSFKLKIILIGRDLAKNRLINRIIKNRYAANYKLTVGVDILTKDVEFNLNDYATLSIWDISLQQRFEFVRSTFYKGAAGALLIFDLTREQTYIEARKWLTEIRQFSNENIPFVLIGNKADLLEEVGEVIDRDEARAFAEREDGLYVEASPNDINVVEDAVNVLTRRIIGLRSRS